MNHQYQQSQNIEQIRARHPFPWREQRRGPQVRMVDANGAEVILFELTALAAICTHMIANTQSPVTTDAK